MKKGLRHAVAYTVLALAGIAGTVTGSVISYNAGRSEGAEEALAGIRKLANTGFDLEKAELMRKSDSHSNLSELFPAPYSHLTPECREGAYEAITRLENLIESITN